MLLMSSSRYELWLGVRVIVFNATFNNISAISWRSVLLVRNTGIPGKNHRRELNQILK
jgi:hypothetical protein